MTTYFHGGSPTLKPGMFVLPPVVTNAPSCSEYGAAGIHRRDRVYLASTYESALIFAAAHPSGRGVVCECEPIGEVEPDPDWLGEPGGSVQVPRARVLRVHRVYPSIRRRVIEVLMQKGGAA